MAAHSHQSVDGDKVPVIQVVLVSNLVLDKFQFLGRIVDEGAQVLLLPCAEGVVEDRAHLTLNPTAGIAQHMLEGQVLTVEVSQEMLGAFRQVEDGFEIDDLGACGGNIWEAAG